MKIYVVVLLLCAHNVFADDGIFLGHYDGYGIPPPVDVDTNADVENTAVTTTFFIQTLDHYDPTNPSLFWQRYRVNTQFFNASEGNVAFLFVGSEGQASASWMTAGAWIQSARTYGAILFQLEHRYYGQSHPYGNIATANLRYLTSQQALEDIATFITAMNEEYNLPADVKWILFGGSYSASLAVWARQKYPHLVDGVVASSGPVYAELDFNRYYDVVVKSLATHSKECVNTVRTAFSQLEHFIQNPEEENVTALFNLCFDIDDSAYRLDENIDYLFERLKSRFGSVVQFTGISGQPTISTICDILTDESNGREIDRLAQVNRLFSGTSCLNYRFQSLLTALSSTTITANGNSRQWYYQTCTEFGWYQTTTQEDQIFGNRNPIDFYIKICSIFGTSFNTNFTDANVKRINRHYGGFNINVTKVAHVHGSLDPWNAVGLMEPLNEEAPVIIIEGTSHCTNMYPISVNDPPTLTKARETIDWLIGLWVGKGSKNSGVRVELPITLVIVIGLLSRLF